MKKNGSVFPVLFALVILFCVLFVAWYIPSVHFCLFSLEDYRLRLESMQGQVRKQQYEYDQTVAELPDIQAELDKILPENETAEAEVRSLKDERKKLRKEKEDLTVQAALKEEADHE